MPTKTQVRAKYGMVFVSARDAAKAAKARVAPLEARGLVSLPGGGQAGVWARFLGVPARAVRARVLTVQVKAHGRGATRNPWLCVLTYGYYGSPYARALVAVATCKRPAATTRNGVRAAVCAWKRTSVMRAAFVAVVEASGPYAGAEFMATHVYEARPNAKRRKVRVATQAPGVVAA